jgi:hypothetical protein
VLYAREALLLGRRDDLAVTDQAGGAVMIISGYPEDIYRLHSLPEFSRHLFGFLTALPQIMPVPKESPPGAAIIGHRE